MFQTWKVIFIYEMKNPKIPNIYISLANKLMIHCHTNNEVQLINFHFNNGKPWSKQVNVTISQQTLFWLKKQVKSIYSGIEEDSLDEMMMVMQWWIFRWKCHGKDLKRRRLWFNFYMTGIHWTANKQLNGIL